VQALCWCVRCSAKGECAMERRLDEEENPRRECTMTALLHAGASYIWATGNPCICVSGLQERDPPHRLTRCHRLRSAAQGKSFHKSAAHVVRLDLCSESHRFSDPVHYSPSADKQPIHRSGASTSPMWSPSSSIRCNVRRRLSPTRMPLCRCLDET
jgi:hypothetical protein